MFTRTKKLRQMAPFMFYISSYGTVHVKKLKSISFLWWAFYKYKRVEVWPVKYDDYIVKEINSIKKERRHSIY